MTEAESKILKSDKFENLEILIRGFSNFENAALFLELTEEERIIILKSTTLKNIIRSWGLERIKQISSHFDIAIEKAAKLGKINELLSLKAVFDAKEKAEDVLKIFHYPIAAKDPKSEKK
jgi:hypothetical protein